MNIDDTKHIEANENNNLAVIVHAYYMDIFQELLEYYKVSTLHRSNLQVKFFITVPADQEENAKFILRGYYFDYFLMPVENKGRDILPFLTIFPKVEAEGFTLLLKLHTKKSSHLWRRDIFNKLISPHSVNRILERIQYQPEIGIIAPSGHLLPIALYLTNNLEKVVWLAERMGVNKDQLYLKQFVSGSMFFAKLTALKPLIDLTLNIDDFEDESGQTDGTLAHAVERVFSISVYSAGFLVVPSIEVPEWAMDDYPYAPTVNDLNIRLLDQIKELNTRVESTDIALNETKQLAIARLNHIEMLRSRIDSTEIALNETKNLAVSRLEQIEKLNSCIESTDNALNETKSLALSRLEQIEMLNSRIDSTEKALTEIKQLAITRLKNFNLLALIFLVTGIIASFK